MADNKTKTTISTKDEPVQETKYTFDDVYKAVIHLLTNGTKEQQAKVLKQLNEGEGDWMWLKTKVITDAYSYADAKEREEFSLIGMEKHLKSGNAKLMGKIFTDTETGVRYRQYRFKNGYIYRIPYVTEEMDKYAYDKAINKKFIGDFIVMSNGTSEDTFIPLDTTEKVQAYNKGEFFQKYDLHGKQKPLLDKAVKVVSRRKLARRGQSETA